MVRTEVRNWTMAATRTVAGHCTGMGTVAPVGPALWRSHTIETNGTKDWWRINRCGGRQHKHCANRTLTMNNFILTKLLF